MYLLTTILFIGYVTWWIIARKEKVSVDASALWKPFYKMAQFLYKKLCIYKIEFPQSAQVRKNLKKLYPEEPIEQTLTEYYVKKTAMTLAVLMMGIILSTALKLQADTGGILSDSGLVKRGTYEEGSKNIRLKAGLGKEFEKVFELEIVARTLTRPEAEELLFQFWEEAVLNILGDNNELNKITKELNLAEEWEGYPFLIQWKSSSPEVVSHSGKVSEVQEEINITLNAMICYEEWEWNKELLLTITPPVRTKEEQLEIEINKILLNAEVQGREKAEWSLPDTLEGQKINWKEKKEDNSIIFLCLAIITSAGIFFLSDKDLHDGVKKKKVHMKDAYPVIVNKLALYLGAGMTVRGAYCKIAENYQTEVRQGRKNHPAYDEMLHTYRELQAGISEGTAYEHFGRRSGLQEYIRLATLLTQNLKKGNSALLGRLREEASIAMEERIHLRKQAGEEASTKLLVPMIMMLALVMIFIMIPAFTSFGM